MKKLQYGIAMWDRYTGSMGSHVKFHMEGTCDCGPYEFLKMAEQNGWELCGTMPGTTIGANRVIGPDKTRKAESEFEVVDFVFKRIES